MEKPAYYRAIWRWHFYAGLACIPFILWLACTGAIYVWKPQVDALIDRPYDHLPITGPVATPGAQVRAALAALPGSTFKRYELQRDRHSAARVIVTRNGKAFRIYIDPSSLLILKTVGENDRLMQVVFRLHGELLMGNLGSYVVELAASWAIVMILSGLYLWWPRGTRLAGVLWPRLGASGRPLWRDLHAVIGFWVSALALFMLMSGLPWAKGWGTYFQELRSLSGTAVAHQDWPVGSEPTEHAAHRMAMRGTAARFDAMALDRVVPTARALNFAAPVLIDPPAFRGGAWVVASEAQDRPLRANAT
ncbi:MAG TPA: PepSY domain-containing protein, partial [Candidatus Saccharimonadales bacterium]|nr:PepSY domain-containing protein [Candidatus Saccharimonadales bacterium]